MGHCHAILWPNLLNYRFTDEDIMNGHPIIFAIASVVCILCIRGGRGPPTALGRLLNVAIMVIEYSFAIEIAGRMKKIPVSATRSRNPT